jgi:hypothetical protein
MLRTGFVALLSLFQKDFRTILDAVRRIKQISVLLCEGCTHTRGFFFDK